jgi:hypothetical protein
VANDGYWDNDKFMAQVQDIMDCVHVMYPDYQVVIEVDWSSGHAKKSEGALNANEMNMNHGGKQPEMRLGKGSIVTAHCLGPHSAVLRNESPTGSTPMDCKLRMGQVQHFVFQQGDPPPFYDLACPTSSIKDDAGEKVLKQGYVGQPKGLKQVLWERGLWEHGLTQERAKALLSACEDFKSEPSSLEELVQDIGGLLIMSPKGHPELAGKGVEYSWGYSKRYFRANNDCVAKHLHQNIVTSISQEQLPVERVRSFARRAREYRNAYKYAHDHKSVEACKAKQKSHRCVMWMEWGFLSGIARAAAAAGDVGAAGVAAL